jgi:hypothetical protein
MAKGKKVPPHTEIAHQAPATGNPGMFTPPPPTSTVNVGRIARAVAKGVRKAIKGQ